MLNINYKIIKSCLLGLEKGELNKKIPLRILNILTYAIENGQLSHIKECLQWDISENIRKYILPT